MRGIRFPYGAPDSDDRGQMTEDGGEFTYPSSVFRRPSSITPLAQLVERSAYTRRELRTGARLEVRILQGVPSCFALRASQDCGRARREAGCPPKPLAEEGCCIKQ